MRLLQLSDPHLLADPQGICRDRAPFAQLRHGLEAAHRLLAEAGLGVDQLLISGDLCQDESWGGYVRLGELLASSSLAALPPPWLMPGNHDHSLLLRAALGRRMRIAPARILRAGWRILLLDSHRPGRLEGHLGARQLAWIQAVLQPDPHRPTLVVLHHPPVPIGDPGLDAIALRDGEALIALLAPLPGLRGVLFGHIHQHWQGELPGRIAPWPPVPLLGCPSTLRSFAAVQPCPLARPEDPGGRWLQLAADGTLRQRLLRWPAAAGRTRASASM